MPNAKGQPVIAVDGTSASGKSTLSEELAREASAVRLEYSLVFRAIAMHMNDQGFDASAGHDPSDAQIAEAVRYAQSIKAMEWKDFTANIKDNPELRSIETSRTAPYFSGHPAILAITDEVLKSLIDMSPKPVIAEGRTIGRYVYPQADVKFFIDATLYRRAERRHASLSEKGKTESFETVLADLAKRDHQDQTRQHQPTTFDPSNQWWLDTTTQSITETLDEAKAKIGDVLGKNLFASKGRG